MANNKNNMDNFLRDSLGDLTVKPSQSVWKGITKRLIILELLRLNFTNIGKVWLYSGMATIATISGLTYFNLTQNNEENPLPAATRQTEQTTNEPKTKEAKQLLPDEVNNKTTAHKVLAENQKTNEAKNLSEEKEIIKTDLLEETIEPALKNKIQQEIPIKSTEDFTEIRVTDLPRTLNSISLNHLPEPKATKTLAGIGRGQMIPFTKFEEVEEKTKPKTKNTHLNWYLAASYNPEWPLSNEDMYVNNHQLALNAGLEYKKWKLNVGLGVRTEKTPSMYTSHFQSYDSVGYYYDIDYYEINPDNPDSIVLFYTVENLYDSVAHQSHSHGPDQNRRWVFIPFSLGYQVHTTSKYQLYANIFGQYGWQTYLEKTDMNLVLAAGSTMEDITPDANTNYLQIGVGLENNFNVFPHWWIYAEPRINYYINTPFSINQTTGNGPYSFGIKVGVKYKFKRR